MEAKRVDPKLFGKKIEVPSSKSYANRLLILAAINEKPITISNLPLSTDVDHMISCLKKLGLDIIQNQNSVMINNSFPSCESKNSEVELFTGDGGTTTRFLIALVSRGTRSYKFKVSHRMMSREMNPLYLALRKIGCEVESGEDYLVRVTPHPIEKPKEVEIDCAITTQFYTGLRLIYDDIKIKPINMNSSHDYVRMTEHLKKNLKQENTVPIDFSSASYPIALGVFLGGVLIQNCLELDKFQADAKFLSLLKKMGVNWKLTDKGLEIPETHNLVGCEVDCNEHPDLIPTLAFLASYAKTPSKMMNTGVLHDKESDRILEIVTLLNLFKVDHHYDQNNEVLYINGNAKRITHEIHCHPPVDHRIAMVSYLFLRYNYGGLLYNYNCVDKSFANFYEVME